MKKRLDQVIYEAIDSKMGRDIVVVDFEERSILADYFVICTAGNIRQIEAIVESIVTTCKINDIELKSIQGKAEQGWVVVDAHDIVVHIFDQRNRDVYQLERLYQQYNIYETIPQSS